MRKPQLFIGVGAGRCGTNSLVDFVNTNGGYAIHETGTSAFPPVYRPDTKTETIVRNLAALAHGGHQNKPVVGDVSFTLVPHAENILHALPDAKCVWLTRNYKPWFDSVIRNFPDRNTDEGHYGFSSIDYPDAHHRADRLAAHYNWTNRRYDALHARFGSRVLHLMTEDLSDPRMLRLLGDFLGFENLQHIRPFHKNRTE